VVATRIARGQDVTTRDEILDSAMEVMRTRGLARTTTKEIARVAGFSEGTLYKVFADKTHLILSVLSERLPQIALTTEGVADLVGKNSVEENLTVMVVEIERCYRAILPTVMSLFSDMELLALEIEAANSRGGPGPGVMTHYVGEYLRGEQAAGRVSATTSVDSAAFALVGACMHHAFLGSFSDLGSVDYQEAEFGSLAEGIVATVLHGVLP
jgi:AcrR family transcriptional regulator